MKIKNYTLYLFLALIVISIALFSVKEGYNPTFSSVLAVDDNQLSIPAEDISLPEANEILNDVLIENLSNKVIEDPVTGEPNESSDSPNDLGLPMVDNTSNELINNTPLDDIDLNQSVENVTTHSENITALGEEEPQFPFQNKDSRQPDDFSHLRPELIRSNNSSLEIKNMLEEGGYLVRSVSFGLDKEGYYVMSALIETRESDFDLESRDILRVLYEQAYADYYGVEIVNTPQNQFIDYHVPRAILEDLLSGRVNMEEYRNIAGTKEGVLPPSSGPRFRMINGQRVS